MALFTIANLVVGAIGALNTFIGKMGVVKSYKKGVEIDRD